MFGILVADDWIGRQLESVPNLFIAPVRSEEHFHELLAYIKPIDLRSPYEPGHRTAKASQELNCVLSDILMKQGRAKESVECLERALRIDYQDSFQHSVSQDAIMCWLAQAYEASGQPDKAESLYEVVSRVSTRGHVQEYAGNRLVAISVSK